MTPELDEVALINISLSFAYWTIDYRFVVHFDSSSRALSNALSQAQFYKSEPVRQGFPFLDGPSL